MIRKEFVRSAVEPEILVGNAVPQQSLTGTCRASDVSPDRQIKADKIGKLKFADRQPTAAQVAPAQ
jgi:hypothetical protein